jgi:carbon storage regulator
VVPSFYGLSLKKQAILLGVPPANSAEGRTPRGCRASVFTHCKEAAVLVLSRQRDETIMIGNDIEVTVVDIRGDKVRLGINAPKDITVHRKEVYDAIRRENRAAAQVKPGEIVASGVVTTLTGPAAGGGK